MISKNIKDIDVLNVVIILFFAAQALLIIQISYLSSRGIFVAIAMKQLTKCDTSKVPL